MTKEARLIMPYVNNALLSVCAIIIAVVFFNVFSTGEDYFNGLRLGKVFFYLDTLYLIIPLSILIVLYQFRDGLDWVSVFLIAFVGWILFIGRDGGIWNDEKALYFLTGLAFYVLVKSFIDFINQKASNNGRSFYLISVLLVIVSVGIAEAMIGELQVLGRYQIYHSIYRVTGTFFNPAPYAGFLIACLPYVLVLIYSPKELVALTAKREENSRLENFATSEKRLFVKLFATIFSGHSAIGVLHWVGLVTCMLIAAILPATQSRAAWMGLVVSGTYFLFHQYKIGDRFLDLYKSRKRILQVSFVGIFILGIVGCHGIYLFKKDSADGRLLIWKVSANMLKENLWTGTGFNTFQAHYAPALGEYFESGQGTKQEEILAGNVQWAFNEPLQFAVELGVPGALLFVILIMAALYLPVKADWQTGLNRLILLAARSSLLAVFVFGLFSYPFYSPPVTLVFFFSLAVVAGSSRQINWRIPTYLKSVAFLVFLFLISLNTYGRVPDMKQAYWLWDEAESLYGIKAYDVANESFKEALPILETNGLFMQQYGKCLQMAGDQVKAKAVLERSGDFYKDDFWYLTLGEVNKELKNFAIAETFYHKASAMVPYKLYPKYLLAKLYIANNQLPEAKVMAEKILTSEVKVMSTAVKEIQQEMRDVLDQPMVKHGSKEEPEKERRNSILSGSYFPTPDGKEVRR